MDCKVESARKLRDEIDRVSRGKLTDEQMAAVTDSLDPGSAYIVRATGVPNRFAEWITLRSFETKHAGKGRSRICDRGIPVIGRDLEFGKHIRYDYRDAGIRIHNEERRISNFNTTAVIVSLILTEETGDDAADHYERTFATLNLYVPRRLWDERSA